MRKGIWFLPVPEDGLGLQNGLLEELSALQTGIETHPAFGDTLSVGSSTGLFERISVT